MRSARSAQGSFRRLAFNKKSNTWKAMITTNAKAECVPGIWNKWRNAYMNSFKRDVAWTRSGERQPTPKVKDAKAQERRVSSQYMRAASDLKDTVLEFSRGGFGQAERGDEFTGHTWSGNTDSRPEDRPRWEAVSPVSKVLFGAWDRWPARGIPELASPLAD